MHFVVFAATELLCMTVVAMPAVAQPWRMTAHDHADDNVSSAVHCWPCAAESIAPSPKLSIPALPQGAIDSPLLGSPGNGLPHELDRPPLALL
jgi:hypothetical protein